MDPFLSQKFSFLKMNQISNQTKLNDNYNSFLKILLIKKILKQNYNYHNFKIVFLRKITFLRFFSSKCKELTICLHENPFFSLFRTLFNITTFLLYLKLSLLVSFNHMKQYQILNQIQFNQYSFLKKYQKLEFQVFRKKSYLIKFKAINYLMKYAKLLFLKFQFNAYFNSFNKKRRFFFKKKKVSLVAIKKLKSRFKKSLTFS